MAQSRIILFFFFLFGSILTVAAEPKEEKPFEKVYVTWADFVTMPDGMYYVDKSGEKIPVKTVQHDWDGMYIVKLRREVVLNTPEEDESYPAQRYLYPNPTPKVHPKIWDRE